MLKGLIREDRLDTLSPEARDEVVRALREYDRKREQDPLSLYFPHSRQHIFHSFRSPVKVFLGGTQSGKTTAGLADDLIQALPEEDLPSHLRQYKRFAPPFEARIMAPSAQVLETVTYSKLRELIPTHTYLGGTWSKAFDSLTRTLHLACGSKLYFMTYEQDVGKMGGASIDRVHYDEQPPEPARNECRWRVAAKSGDEIFTMTPMEGLSWTYDAFGIEEGKEVSAGVHRFGEVAVVRVDIDDNPALGEKEKARALHGLSDAERAARKEGRFVALHGLIYEEFRSERHVIPAIEELPKNVNTVVGIDPGMGVAAGVVWAYLGVNDQLVVFDEHKPEGATVADVAKAIHTINAHYNVKPLYYVIDPIARNKNHQTGRSDQMEYADHGIVSIAGQNAVRPGLNRIKERLRAEDADEDPKLVITANCPALIKEIKRYRWKQPPRSGEDSTEKPVKKDDHLLDALRYLVMSRPYLPEPFSENTETELEKAVREDQERGDSQDLDHEYGGVFC